MTVKAFKIKKQFVDSLKEPGFYRDNQLKGFGVKVTANSKIYIVENKVKGTRKNPRVTIGKHGVFTAEEARIQAKRYLAMMAQGINPNDHKKDEQSKIEAKEKVKSLTLEQVFSDYCGVRKLKTDTKKDYHKILNRCLKNWMQKPIVEITKDMVEKRHHELSIHQAQANLAMRVLRALFTYANITYEDDQGHPIVPDNPVKRLSQVRAWNRIARRQSIIQKHQLKDWYQSVMSLINHKMRDYLLLCLFTGLRRNEAAKLKWSNIDFKAQTLKLEAHATKNSEPHELPLPEYLLKMFVVRILGIKEPQEIELTERLYKTVLEQKLQRNNEYVFPGDGKKSGHLVEPKCALASIAKKTGIDFMIHDLRRTFLTVAEGLDIPHYALKRLANHKSSADVTAGYIVPDIERLREPMNKITNYLKAEMGIDKAEKMALITAETIKIS